MASSVSLVYRGLLSLELYVRLSLEDTLLTVVPFVLPARQHFCYKWCSVSVQQMSSNYIFVHSFNFWGFKLTNMIPLHMRIKKLRKSLLNVIYIYIYEIWMCMCKYRYTDLNVLFCCLCGDISSYCTYVVCKAWMHSLLYIVINIDHISDGTNCSLVVPSVITDPDGLVGCRWRYSMVTSDLMFSVSCTLI